MAGSLIKGLIGKEDLSIQTNANATETFTRSSSVGGTNTLEKFPDIWDGTGAIDLAEITVDQIETAIISGLWVDPRDSQYGAVYDANYYDSTTNDWYVDAAFTTLATDNTAAINAAIQDLITTDNSASRDYVLYSTFEKAKILYFPSGYIGRINSPILAESDPSASPITYLDNLLILGWGFHLVAGASFSGVAREYDTIGGSDTHKAMIMLGPKEPGKEGIHFQLYNQVHGMTFHGNKDQDLCAVYIECGHGYIFSKIHMEKMGYGIKGRVCKNSRADTIYALQVHSGIYMNNDTRAICTNDANAKWGAPYLTSNNWKVSNYDYQTSNITAGVLEANVARGALHFQNVGEVNFTNLTIFGGTKGLVFIQDSESVEGQSWNTISDAEIDGQEQEAVYVVGKRHTIIANIVCGGAVRDLMTAEGWTTLTYDKPYFYFENCNNCNLSNLIAARNLSGSDRKGGQSFYFKDCNGTNATNLQSNGYSIEADNTYAHVYLENCDNNNLDNLKLGVVSGGTNKFKQGVYFDADSDNNTINNIQVKNLYAEGAEVVFAASGSNVIKNLMFSRASGPGSATQITDNSATPSWDVGDKFQFVNTSSTSVTNPVRNHEGKIVVLEFANGNTTIVHDVTKIVLRGACNYRGRAYSTLVLQCFNGVWFEIGRSGDEESGSGTLASGTLAISFGSNMPSATYKIMISGDANETFYWASKAVTGFTINSSNGSSTANVDWRAFY